MVPAFRGGDVRKPGLRMPNTRYLTKFANDQTASDADTL